MPDDTATGPGEIRIVAPSGPEEQRGYVPPPAPIAATDRRPAPLPSTPKPVTPTPTAPRPGLPRPHEQSGYTPPKQPTPKPPTLK